jgi:hypothetical protein
VLEDVRLSLARDDLRPALLAEAVGRLVLDQVRYPAVAGVDTPLVLSNVTRVVSPDTRLRAPDRADPTRP